MDTTQPPPAPPPPPPITATPSPAWQTINASTLQCNICAFNAVTMVLIPVLVVYGLIQNGFALEVLQSPFLSDLPSQPILKALLTLQSALLITGPLYVWLTQAFGPVLTVGEVCPCFFLSWFHDFLTMTTSWLLVTWMIERAISIGKLKETWIFWRMRFLEVAIILVGVALIVTLVGGIFNGSLSGEYRDVTFSMDTCLPWLDMERTIAFPNWPRLRAVLFSLAPCLALFVFFISLVMSVYYLYFKMNRLIQGTAHYQINLAIIRNAAQIKFVYTLVCVCPIFFLTCLPIGLSMYLFCSDGNVNILVKHGGTRIDFGGVTANDYPEFVTSGNFSYEGNNEHVPRRFDQFQRFGKSDQHRENSSNDENGNQMEKIEDGSNFKNESSKDKAGQRVPGGSDGIDAKPDRQSHVGVSNKFRSLLQLLNSRERSIEKMDGNNTILNTAGISVTTTAETRTFVFLGVGKSESAKNGGGNGVENGTAHGQHDDDDDEEDDEVGEWGKRPSPRLISIKGVNIVCAMWFLYYSFSLVIVPMLLITEPLFRNEWINTWRELKKCICFDCCESTSGAPAADRLPVQSNTRDTLENLDAEIAGQVTSENVAPRNNSNVKTFVVRDGEFKEVEDSQSWDCRSTSDFYGH